MNLQEKIRTLLKEEYEREYILYRAVGLDEAIKSCEAGHLVYYSRDPMSRDWEVIEYGLGDEASEMSEEEVDDYVNDLVSWTPNSKGVNLTTDLENANGYSDIVLEINLVGYDYAEFSDVHIFAKNPDDCKIKSVYYNGKQYTKEGFLDITKSLQESKQKEEIKAPIFFRRRINPDYLYKDFRHSLLYVSNFIREKPSLINFNDYSVDRFKIAVITTLMDEYYDMLLDSVGNDFPWYDEIYDYLYARYESEMEDEYNDLIDNLQYNINQ